MATRSDPLPTWIARVLSTYSLLVYVAGLAVIVAARLLEGNVDVPFPPELRRTIVVVTLAVMVVTYLAERRFAPGRYRDGQAGHGPAVGAGDDGAPEYSLQARAAMAAAAVGVAIGIYAALALDRFLVGGLFVLGAYLFVHVAYRREGDGGEA